MGYIKPLQAEAQDVRHALDDTHGWAGIGDAGGETIGDPEASHDLVQRHDAAIEAGDNGLAANRL
jgi:hypothetical protein